MNLFLILNFLCVLQARRISECSFPKKRRSSMLSTERSKILWQPQGNIFVYLLSPIPLSHFTPLPQTLPLIPLPHTPPSLLLTHHSKNPNAVDVCTADNRLAVLLTLSDRLDNCQKSLSDYLGKYCTISVRSSSYGSHGTSLLTAFTAKLWLLTLPFPALSVLHLSVYT